MAGIGLAPCRAMAAEDIRDGGNETRMKSIYQRHDILPKRTHRNRSIIPTWFNWPEKAMGPLKPEAVASNRRFSRRVFYTKLRTSGAEVCFSFEQRKIAKY